MEDCGRKMLKQKFVSFSTQWFYLSTIFLQKLSSPQKIKAFELKT